MSRAQLLLLVLFLILPPLSGRAAPKTKSAASQFTVVVLPFHNATGKTDLNAICLGLVDLIPACAAKSERITFLERQRIDAVMAEQKLSLKGLSGAVLSVKVGKLTGAKYAISGSIVLRGDRIGINTHLYEVETARVAASSKVEGKLSDLLDVVQSATGKLMQKVRIDLPSLSNDDIDQSPKGNLHFMRGLGYYHSNMPHHAIAEFMKAIAVDPDHAMSRYWNARVYFDQGEYDHARAELTRFVTDFPDHKNVEEAKALLSAATSRKAK